MKKVILLFCSSFFIIACSERIERNMIQGSLYNYSLHRSYIEACDISNQIIKEIEDMPTKSGLNRELDKDHCYVKISETNPDDTLFYALNMKDNEGFSIIAASRNYFPIIAIVDNGHYIPDVESGNESFDDYMSSVSEMLSGPRGVIPYYYYDYFERKDSCNALLTVSWGQTDVYGEYCPNGVAGCVATAVAQIMSYHEKPEFFIATVDMGEDYAIGDTVFLNWPLIKQHITNHNNTQICDSTHNQISALLREIGDLVNMQYYTNPNRSASSINNVPDALDYFGYEYHDISDAVAGLIEYSIKRGSPVYMRGTSDGGSGHAWVADGYKVFDYWRTPYYYDSTTGTYLEGQSELYNSVRLMHINWGWNGICNGFFQFNNYNTSDAVEYDGGVNFASYNFAYNVQTIRLIRYE